jgi:hypothetical protein
MRKAIVILAVLISLQALAYAVEPEEAVTLIKYLKGVTPEYYISGNTVLQIYENAGLDMDFPDYTLVSKYPIYKYDPQDLSTLKSVYSVAHDDDGVQLPILYKVLGGPFTKTRYRDGTYAFHWIVADPFSGEIDLIRIDPYWIDSPVVMARYPLNSIETYSTGQGTATSPGTVSYRTPL